MRRLGPGAVVGVPALAAAAFVTVLAGALAPPPASARVIPPVARSAVHDQLLPLPPLPLPPLPPIDVPPIEVPGSAPIDIPPVASPPAPLLPSLLPDLPPATGPPISAGGAAPAASHAGSLADATDGASGDPHSTDPVVASREGPFRLGRQPMASVAELVDQARTNVLELSARGVPIAGLRPLADLLDRVVRRIDAITMETVELLTDALNRVLVVVPAALHELLDPVEQLVTQILGGGAAGVVPPVITPWRPDGTGPGAGSPGTVRNRSGGGAPVGSEADREQEREGGGSGSGGSSPDGDDRSQPRRSVPVGSDLVLFGSSLLVPAPIPLPRGGTDSPPPAISTGTAGWGARSDRSNHDAVLPGVSSTESPAEARAPPTGARTLRTLGRGPEARPG